MKRYYQRNLSTAHKVSLVAMFSAMSIIVLYLSALLPTGTIGFYFLSSIFVGGMLVERKPGSAFAVYVVVSLLALILRLSRLRFAVYPAVWALRHRQILYRAYRR